MAEIVDIKPDQIPVYKWEDLFKLTKLEGVGLSQYGSALSPIATDFQSPNFKEGSSGWRLTSAGDLEANNGTFRGALDGATGTFSGSLTAGSLDIPDTTTANSFHVNNTGDAWWGATTLAGAVAKVLKTGAATFSNITITGGSLNINGGIVDIDTLGNVILKSASIGGSNLQYTMGDFGIFSFGDGSDGDVTISVDTNLTSDKYYDNLTINSGKILSPAGYRIFVRKTLTVNGTISGNGNNGSNGGNASSGVKGTGGAGGSALADGYLKGSLAGTAGANGVQTNEGFTGGTSANNNTTNPTNSLGVNGVQGGTGGGTPGHPEYGGAVGTAGTVTASNVKLIANWHLATLLDIGSTGSSVKFDNSAGSTGGGGGGKSANGPAVTVASGGGGGAGSSGRIVAIYAKEIIVNVGGSITANGGNGGNGGNGFAGGNDAGGGGGGGGGAGGQIIVVYNSLTNSGTISASGGTYGTGGSGAGGGSNGSVGTNGNAGTIRYFKINM